MNLFDFLNTYNSLELTDQTRKNLEYVCYGMAIFFVFLGRSFRPIKK